MLHHDSKHGSRLRRDRIDESSTVHIAMLQIAIAIRIAFHESAVMKAHDG
jgi:hypothetical protein